MNAEDWPAPRASGKEQPKCNLANIVSNEILNLMEFLQLLSVCCEGKSDLAEQKCQNEILTLDNADYAITHSKHMWPLKKNLVNYVIHTFIDSGDRKLMTKAKDPKGDEAIWKIAETLLSDLETINEEERRAVFHFPHGVQVTLQEAGVDCAVTAIVPFYQQLFKRKSPKPVLGEEAPSELSEFPKLELIRKVVGETCKLYQRASRKVQKKEIASFLQYIDANQTISSCLDNTHAHQWIRDAEGTVLDENFLEEEKSIAYSAQHTILETGTNERSKSQKFASKVTKISQLQETKDKIEKEFEELVTFLSNIETKFQFVLKKLPNSGLNERAFDEVSFGSVITALM